MELKQIAESITRVTHAKKIQQDKSSFAQMVLSKFGPPIVRTTRGMASDNTKVVLNDKNAKISKDNIGLMNRPLTLVESLENEQQKEDGKVDHLFRLEFDSCVGISPTWVDTKTLNYFNKLRDNIFASSG